MPEYPQICCDSATQVPKALFCRRQGTATIDVDRMQQRLNRADHALVVASLREVQLGAAVDLLATYVGRASDLAPWLADAERNRDFNLRLQYLAGLGLNTSQRQRIYG